MPWQDTVIAFSVAAAASAALVVSRWREALNTDEAYLWYGVLRVLEGRLPHRDFRSYEPGRYFFCAAFAFLFGKGLTVVRVATHVFYALGLAAALLALRRLGLPWPPVIAGAVLLASWAHPMHKLFEPALLMFGFFGLSGLLLDQTPVAAAAAGAIVGVALFFGFNYFLYVGAGLVVLWLTAMPTDLALAWPLAPWIVVGVLLGGAPFLALLLVPGFGVTFVERRVRAVLTRRTTNLPLPIPWLWRRPPRQLDGLGRARQLGIQLLFALLPVVPISTVIAFALVGHRSPTWIGAVAAASLGAVVWHHAYSRADSAHLAQSMPALCLLATIGLGGSSGGGFAALVLLALCSTALALAFHPWVCRRAAPTEYVVVSAAGKPVWMPRWEAELIECAGDLCSRELGSGGALLALPTLVALYPILGRTAPVYDIFSVYPAEAAEQERMIDSIRQHDVRLAVVSNAMLDAREALRFSATHPLVWGHLHRHMEPLTGLGLAPHLHVFRKPVAEMDGA